MKLDDRPRSIARNQDEDDDGGSVAYTRYGRRSSRPAPAVGTGTPAQDESVASNRTTQATRGPVDDGERRKIGKHLDRAGSRPRPMPCARPQPR